MIIQLNIPVAPLMFHPLDLLNVLLKGIRTKLLGLQVIVQLLFPHLLLVLAEQMFIVLAAR